MSYSHSKPIPIGDNFINPADSIASFDGSLPFIQSTDRSIDAALRGVPLPDGLLTRLKKLAYTVSDEAADHADYLGC